MPFACMIKELDCVALAADLPEHGLAAGDVGAVVHAHEGGHSYPVEFTTYDGRTVAVAKVSAAQNPSPRKQGNPPHPRI
jgi:hypothetical protein